MLLCLVVQRRVVRNIKCSPLTTLHNLHNLHNSLVINMLYKSECWFISDSIDPLLECCCFVFLVEANYTTESVDAK